VANAYNYSNTAQQTTLGGNITGAATSITVGATTGFPNTTPYVLALDYGAATEELVVVTAVAGTTLTVTRGFSGTSAQSHSIGAVIRHVVNAQDLIDFRTHEAATSDVHGVTGALVGATQVQTLTNKTLTSPTINGAALSGTFTGAPAFSGGVNFTSTVTSTQSAATNTSVATIVTADTFDRFRLLADGDMEWGPGNAARDTNLYRSAANTLKTDDALVVAGELQPQNLVRGTRASSTDSQYESRVTGDANARWYVRTDGQQGWGPGSATQDTFLYRNASGVLRTSGALVVDGALTVSGSTTWSTYTPTVGNAGTATWTTRTGYYWKLGKVVFVVVYLDASGAGSGTGILTVDMPSAVDRSARQALTVHAETVTLSGAGAATVRGGECVFFTGGSGATADRIRCVDADGDGSGNLQGQDIKTNSLITIQGWYREA
jgi:hypothetical protein